MPPPRKLLPKSKIHYKGGYKYMLVQVYTHKFLTGTFQIPTTFRNRVCIAEPDQLIFQPGFAWDGASGPTIDSNTSMRASMVHDLLYQLICEGILDKKHRKQTDQEFYKILREDGMAWLRAKYYYKAVRMFGGSHAKVGRTNPIIIAP